MLKLMSVVLGLSLVVLPLAVHATPTPSTDNLKELTMLVYMGADNNMDDSNPDKNYLLRDINEIRSAVKSGRLDKMNIAVFADGNGTGALLPAGSNASAGDTVRIYWDENGEHLEYLGERNSGDYREFEQFLRWGMTSFPAKKTMVVLWDHGMGFKNATSVEVDSVPFTPATPGAIPTNDKSKSPVPSSNAAIIVDDASGNELSLEQIRVVLERLKKEGLNVHVLGFDACLMAMVEVAYEFRQVTDMLIFSEETEPMDGWAYDRFLKGLSTFSLDDIAEQVTSTYIAYYNEHKDRASKRQRWNRAKPPTEKIPFFNGPHIGPFDDYPGIGDPDSWIGLNTSPSQNPVTLSAVKTASIDKLMMAIKQSVASFAERTADDLIDISDRTQAFDDSDYLDLGDLMNKAAHSEIAVLLSEVVVQNRHAGDSVDKASGLTIYFPRYSHDPVYDTLQFAKATGWGTMQKTRFAPSSTPQE